MMIERYQDADFTVYCLSDGASTFDLKVFPDLTEARRDHLLAQAGEHEIRTEFNAYLIVVGDQYTLVDTGCGALFGPNCGKVPSLLSELDVSPDAITTLFMTHLHGDHCGGALDQGRIVYPKARVMLHKDEIGYWQGKDAPAGCFLITYGDQITALAEETPFAQGLTPWFLPGHTPGHMGLRVGSKLALVGDIFHSAPLQLADPDIWTSYDVDPILARSSRKSALAKIAAKDLTFAGGHSIAPHKFATWPS
jgi:glyoxylase-like metal-dependent hydrolase (beta-lactamase superfamily II)